MAAITVTETTVINRPMEEVYRYISNCENDVAWCPAVKEVRRTGDVAGAVGAAYFVRHTPGGMKFNATIQVVEANAPDRFRWLLTDAHSRIHGRYELTALEQGTRLTQTSEIDFRHAWKVLGLVMRGYIRNDIQKNLREQFAQLRQVLEATGSKEAESAAHSPEAKR